MHKYRKHRGPWFGCPTLTRDEGYFSRITTISIYIIMAFGILEPKTSLVNIPGTTFLDVHDEASVDNSRFLQKGTGRNAHVVLIPQPSKDPNDPLNWPLWQRDIILLLLTVCTLLTVGG